MAVSIDRAKSLLENGIAEAQELIREPSKIDELLAQLEDRLRDVPAVGETLSDLPLMISMIKGYITKEYSEVSPKVIATMVAAILYMVKKKDIIPDNIPVVGIADDLAVLGLALKLSEPELEAFRAFRDGKKEAPEAAVEEAGAAADEAAVEPEEAAIAEEATAEPEEAVAEPEEVTDNPTAD